MKSSLNTGSSKQNVTFAYIVLLNPTYIQKVSEYDQEIPLSHTEDHPMAPRERVTEHSQQQDIRKTLKESDQLSLPCEDDCKTRKDSK